MPDYLDEETIRKRVIKRMEERQGLLIHAAAYLIVNLGFWLLWLASGGIDSFPWPILITGGWGIGMFAHFIDYWDNYGGGAVRRENQIQREIERERERLGLTYEKPKNDLTIGEDGELFYDEDDEQLTRRR